jgi:hypothetical protein
LDCSAFISGGLKCPLLSVSGHGYGCLGNLIDTQDFVKMTDDVFLFEGVKIASQFSIVESMAFVYGEFLVGDDDIIIVGYLTSGKRNVCLCECW